jgi:hypothetical protein
MKKPKLGEEFLSLSVILFQRSHADSAECAVRSSSVLCDLDEAELGMAHVTAHVQTRRACINE